ncbi:MAG: hypothetical protein AAF961_13875, partial [Planctomycetota bacterium]
MRATDDGVTSVTVVNGVLGSSVQTDQNLMILAEDATNQFSGTGGISRTTGSGAGLAFSVDVISRKTEAFVGGEQYSLGDDQYTPGLGVDSDDAVVLDYDHGFSVGDQLLYTSGGDFAIGGLNDRDVYTVTAAGTNTFSLGRTTAESTATFGVSDVNDSARLMTINLGYNHGFHQGDAVVYRNGGGAGGGGLTDGDAYYVIVVDSQTIALAETISDALAEDEFYFTPFTDVDNSQIYLGYDHGLTEGQPLVYSANGGTPFTELMEGGVYYVRLIPNETKGFALKDGSGNAITLTTSSANGLRHSFQPGFNPSTAVTITGPTAETNHTIDLGYEHGLLTGDAVIYDRGVGGTNLGTLIDGQRYFAIVIDETRIALAATALEANAGRERFIDASQLLDNGDASDATKFDTFDVYTEHGYQDGDTLIYFRNGGANIGLTDGMAYQVRLLPNATSLANPTSKFQLLDSSDNLIELTRAPNDFDIQYFVKVSGRISLGGSPPVV